MFRVAKMTTKYQEIGIHNKIARRLQTISKHKSPSATLDIEYESLLHGRKFIKEYVSVGFLKLNPKFLIRLLPDSPTLQCSTKPNTFFSYINVVD